MSRAIKRAAKPATSRKKKAPSRAGVPSFFVAPTTPFVPGRRPGAGVGIRSAAGAPSPHLIDLRAITAARPHSSTVARAKKERILFSNFSVPRTISEHPERDRVWDQFALLAFAKFIFEVVKISAVGLGRLIALPLTSGVALVDKFDPDRAIEAKHVEAKPLQASAPEVSPQRALRPFNLRRALISFAGTSLVIILPLQAINTYNKLAAVKDQAEAAKTSALDALHGDASLSDAQAAIGAARGSVNDLGAVGNALLDRVPKLGREFSSGKALLEAGDSLTQAADMLSRSLDFLNDASLDITAKIARAEDLAKRAKPLLASADRALARADALPEGVAGDVASLRERVSSMNRLVGGFIELAPALRATLGETGARRYLVIFQNNAELRPTGGFIGSFAVVDIDRGAIKRIEVPAGGPYDLQGSLKARVLSPEPLRLVSAKWEFQDANWFPDFPQSAKKLMWFYGQSSGPSVDGVISLNAPVLAELLDAVGPINMPAYKTIATGATVLTTAQEIVESAAARESGKPKQFIADLLPLVLDKVVSGDEETTLRALTLFARALDQKDIQMSFVDPANEEAFARRGWTGELAAAPDNFDSLMLVRANIAGAKTDAVIKTTINHESVVSADGRVIDHVTVTLEHQGKKGAPFTGVRNVTYLRLYAPEGSRLIKAGGDIRPPAPSLFDLPPEGYGPDETLAQVSGAVLHDPTSGAAVNNEFSRTVFGVWTQTDPGAASTVTFDYELPFTVEPTSPAPSLGERLGLAAPAAPTAPFGLLAQKQSGAENTEIRSTLKLPAGWYPSFASPEGIAEPDGWTFTAPLNADRAIGAMISRE